MDSEDEREYEEMVQQKLIEQRERVKQASIVRMEELTSTIPRREHPKLEDVAKQKRGDSTSSVGSTDSLEELTQTNRTIRLAWQPSKPTSQQMRETNQVLFTACNTVAQRGLSMAKALVLANRNMITRLKTAIDGRGQSRYLLPGDFSSILESPEAIQFEVKPVTDEEAANFGLQFNDEGMLLHEARTPVKRSSATPVNERTFNSWTSASGGESSITSSKTSHANPDTSSAGQSDGRAKMAYNGTESAWSSVPAWCPTPSFSTYTSAPMDMDLGSELSSPEISLTTLANKRRASVTGNHSASTKKQLTEGNFAMTPTNMPPSPQAPTTRIPKTTSTSGSTSVFVDSRRTNASTAPMRIPKSLSRVSQVEVARISAVASSSATAGPSTFTEKLEMPGWYRGARGDVSNRNLVISLQKIKGDITSALNNRGNLPVLGEHLDKIRVQLHQDEHLHGINEAIMKRTRLLESSGGLPELFLTRRDGYAFPYDIIADAKSLYRKWARADFDPDIMRGIVQKGKRDGKRGSNSIDSDYPHRLSSKFFGNGDLVPGQWWPLLIAALRDGAHGEAQAGISGIRDEGATSIIISRSDYDDVDEGEEMWYTGTEGCNGQMTDDTKLLHVNVRKHKPVRVLRSSKLPETNPFRPSFGFRFDGSYNVLRAEVLDPQKAHYRFKLQRQLNQDPIRYRGVGARPTQHDMAAYRRHQMLSS